MHSRTLIVGIFLSMTLTMSHAAGQSSWSQFRGPNGSGIAPDEVPLPAALDTSKNMIWKRSVPHGHSSPCVCRDRIFLTGMSGTDLETLCIDRKTGNILWQRPAWYEFVERVHRINSPATPTPCTDGQRVFVYIGSSGLMCYDLEGNEVWSRQMRTPPTLYGTAASPILAGNVLVFLNDNQRESYLEAIDPETGKTVWRAEREGFKGSWSTPVHWRNNGVDELVIYGIWWMKAYDLKDGSERWSLPGLTDEPCITPVIGEGLVFLTSYNMKTNTEVIGLPEWSELIDTYDEDEDEELTLEEVRPNKSILSRFDADGEGDHPLWGFFRYLDVDQSGRITEQEWQKMIAFLNSFEQENALLAVRPSSKIGEETTVVWRHHTGIPECPSPLCYRGRVYMVKNGGMITCLDAKTGDLKYQGRLGSGGPYYASLVAGDGKIYAASARGVITVIEAGDTLQVKGRSTLGERIIATPAVLDGKLYVRTDRHLFAFGSIE